MGYLGLFGFVSLLGFVTSNYRLFLFLPLSIFGLLLVRGTDERLDHNLNNACRNAFMFTIIDLMFTLSYLPLITSTGETSTAFGIAFIGTVAVFVFTWVYHNLVRPAE